MKKLLALTLGLIAMAGVLTSCGKSTQPSSPNGGTSGNVVQQAQINDVVATNPQLIDESVLQSLDPMPMADAMGSMPGRHLRWWRHITSVTRTFDTQFGPADSTGNPATAIVTIHKKLVGTFNVFSGDSIPADTSAMIVHKPLEDHWVRKIALQRVRIDSTHTDSTGTPRLRWRIVGTSGVQVTSKDAVTRIQSIRIQAGLVDTLITDPLELHRLRKLIHIADHTDIQVTVKTASADDRVFLYHHDGRVPLHANGDGTFTARWVTGDFEGLRHFGVDAIANTSFTVDTAPYDSQAWVVPFAVRDHDCDVEHDNH